MDRSYALKLAQKYDGKRPASLDIFLKMLDISENEFVSFLQKNRVDDWGFDRSKVKKGKPLPDMKLWSKEF
jgi:hypothetical protein